MADIARLPGAQLDNWEWQGQAACRGMDSSIFFHPTKERNSDRERRVAAAKAVCQQCPAINDCLSHALKVQEPYGIWGGLSENERAKMLGLRNMRYPAKEWVIGGLVEQIRVEQ